jgi:hypothetical protein
LKERWEGKQKGQEDRTTRKQLLDGLKENEDTGIGKGKHQITHTVEKSLWKRVRTSSKTD